MAKTAAGLVEYAKAQLGKPYWYGTFGNKATAALLATKKKQYPKLYNRANYSQGWEHQIGERVHDCVGLIKGYLWSDTPTSVPQYNASQDVSANGMYNACKKKGKISTIPEKPGVLVFLDGHVGVYIGGGYVIEARGHDYGVVKTALKSRPWVTWGECPWIDYGTTTVKATVSTSTTTTTKTTTTTAKTTTTTKQSIEEVAKDVLAGKYGNGSARKKNIEAAGYNYKEVQAKVNELAKNPSSVVKGCKVKVNKGAKSYEGKSVSLFVYLKTYTVDELKGDRAVLDKNGICTAFNVKDLTVQ